jgi:hypothetical protein
MEISLVLNALQGQPFSPSRADDGKVEPFHIHTCSRNAYPSAKASWCEMLFRREAILSRRAIGQ